MLMNNRFVVPAGMVDNVTRFATISAALTTPGLNAGDIIQIEPNSNPGPLETGDIPALKNLTIQGDPAYDVRSVPSFVADSVTIGSALQGFTFKNDQIDIQNGLLDIQTDVTITNCRITNDNNGTAIALGPTSASVISNCYIENADPQNQSDELLDMEAAAGSHNRITDNQFVALTGSNLILLNYTGSFGSADVVAHNTFIGSTGESPLLNVQGGTSGLTIQSNTFTDNSPGGIAIQVQLPVQNLQIVDNVMSFSQGGAEGILVNAGTGSSSMVIASNHIHAGSTGGGIVFRSVGPGSTFSAKVEDNDFSGNYMGILFQTGAGGSVAGIDLGFGSQGSMGANDFRGDTTAIYVFPLFAEGPIEAQTNIFGVADPTTVIHDHNNDSTLAAVVSNPALKFNDPFVETLYLDFLHRTGDLENPKDAGIWVTRMSQGMSAGTVANLVAHSSEALGVAVDGLYHRFLGRDADAAGRASFVSYLQNGGTLESVSQMMLASPEYQSRFPTAASFVQSLYQNLLQRTGSAAEVAGWVARLPQLGRAGVAQGFLLSHEYRAIEVAEDYTWFLHRAGSTADINGWVNTGKDLLTIDAIFAGSQEFQVNG
jgi:hypothetical protein